VAVTNDAPATYPIGVTTVTWTASDAAGNTATATQNIYVSYSSTVGGGSGGTTTPPPAGGGATVTSEAVYWHHNDHLGTPQALTDINGTKVWEMSQTPFGIATVNEDPDGDGITVTNNFRFPGQYFDAETGLNYNYFRSYDPKGGDYTQSDPIGLNGGMNTYAYVDGNPLRWVDSSGLAGGLFGTNRDKIPAGAATTSSGALGEMAPIGSSLSIGRAAKPSGSLKNFSGNSTCSANAARNQPYGPKVSVIGEKITSQMAKRGWSKESIDVTVSRPYRTAPTKDTRFNADGTRNNSPATAYVNKDGSYVVRNNATGDIVQISNRNDPNWIVPF